MGVQACAAALLAGLPPAVPGVTVNRLCGSGLEAVMHASRTIATGDASLCIAGGVESMTRAPWVAVNRDDEPEPTALGWRLVNPRMPAEWTMALGEGAELLAERHGITRQQQDEFALASHRRAPAASAAGRFDDEAVPAARDGAAALLLADEAAAAGAGDGTGPLARIAARSVTATEPQLYGVGEMYGSVVG